jgi:hypothetical protein
MAGNRKAAEKVILDGIEEILPNSPNRATWEERFKNMSDKQFDEFMKSLEDGSGQISLIAPIQAPYKLDQQRNLQIAKRWGHNFFERIWMPGKHGGPAYLSNDRYLIVDLPLRRQAQLLTKKISIPENNRSIDDFTGQPTGASKASKISFPETQVLAAQNLDHSLTEFLKIRGGDVDSFNAANAMISRTGGVSMKAIEHLGGSVKSTDTLKAYLTAMHLETTL